MDDPYDPTDEFGDDDEPRIENIPFGKGFLISVNIGLLKADPTGYSEFDDIFADPEEVTPEDVVLNHKYSVSDVRELTGEIINQFPVEEDLVSQSALWARGVVGMHFFYNANHRTALASLRRLLHKNNLKTFENPFGEELGEETDSLISELSDINENIGEDDMYEKDEIYAVWCSYFEESLP